MTHLNLRRQKSRLLWLIAGILLICGAVGILIFPSETATGAGRGLAYCINILVPSLFPFMALSTLIVISGFAERIGRWFHRTVSVLFYLPGCAGAAIVMSLIGGYPVGAKGIAGLWKQGALTDEQAARMLCFCVNSGTGFCPDRSRLRDAGQHKIRSSAVDRLDYSSNPFRHNYRDIC